MQEIIIEMMNEFGYLGIAMLIFVENIFPPIPSEVILTFGGFMTTYSDMSIQGVVIASTIGSVLGAAILYEVGRFLTGDKVLNLLNGRLGKIIRMKPEHVLKAMNTFNEKGTITVLVCRCIPIVRSLISIPAGMAKMKRSVFFGLTLLGTAVWNTILCTAGAIAGESWEGLLDVIDGYKEVVIVAIILIMAIAFVIYKRIKGVNNVEEK